MPFEGSEWCAKNKIKEFSFGDELLLWTFPPINLALRVKTQKEECVFHFKK